MACPFSDALFGASDAPGGASDPLSGAFGAVVAFGKLHALMRFGAFL